MSIDTEAPRAAVREALYAAADPALRAWIATNAGAVDAALRFIGPFMLYTDADFEALDARLTQEVIDAAVEYSRTRDWNATSTAEARRANEGLERAKRLIAFMTFPGLRRWLRSVDGLPGGDSVLNAAAGFRPHNAMPVATLRAELQAKLPGAIARARRG